jgi:hypothetical protein
MTMTRKREGEGKKWYQVRMMLQGTAKERKRSFGVGGTTERKGRGKKAAGD